MVGETTSRTITLTNTGGLGTKFRFLRASESCEMDISQSAMKLVSVWPAPGRVLWLLSQAPGVTPDPPPRHGPGRIELVVRGGSLLAQGWRRRGNGCHRQAKWERLVPVRTPGAACRCRAAAQSHGAPAFVLRHLPSASPRGQASRGLLVGAGRRAAD